MDGGCERDILSQCSRTMYENSHTKHDGLQKMAKAIFITLPQGYRCYPNKHHFCICHLHLFLFAARNPPRDVRTVRRTSLLFSIGHPVLGGLIVSLPVSNIHSCCTIVVTKHYVRLSCVVCLLCGYYGVGSGCFTLILSLQLNMAPKLFFARKKVSFCNTQHGCNT